ncbi:putative late blight resistance protein-R1B-14-like protein [Hordeum vulgare]|nr:putative late blight resistance protein-R1B-14-like protein [Hordeum vulgare]
MSSILSKLATLMGEEFVKLKNLQREVRFIGDELSSMKDTLEMLSDLEKLDPQTKRWRDTLREMSYDIEDIIDDFMHRIGERSKSYWFDHKMARLLKKFRARYQIANRIKKIKALVLETSARRQRYKLDIPSSTDVPIDQRLATLYENAVNLIGVEGPTNELLDCLKDKDRHLKVVSIVGFGGLGKTTLANEVYRKLKENFDCSAFVPVSQKPDIPKLLSNLLSQLGIVSSIHADASDLLNKLREHLQDKRYLIIVDDIWDVYAWRVIKHAFPKNNLGSRLITTTRIQDVATTCCSDQADVIFEMKPLGDRDSRRLFFYRIFGSEESCPHHLRDVSVEILKKCGGLPLALISISSMLASEGTMQKERWEHVRNSLGSGTNYTLNEMRQILNLSYKDLPCHLKTCLLYLGMYPEDYPIERSNLERQWIAEGFISKENGQDVEKVARNYFNELVNRSLIQPVGSDNGGSATYCRVHDMMLDLILVKSAEENFFVIIDDPRANMRLDYKARRLSIRCNGRKILKKIDMSKVRSFMLFGRSDYTPPLSEFRFLRVLFIDTNNGTIDLTGLCKLHQLRYLCIGSTGSCQLPTQIRMLQHLETLDLYSCGSLPSDIVHLPRLMYLSVPTRLPNAISNLKSLRYLFIRNFSADTPDNIRGLQELTNLRYVFIPWREFSLNVSGVQMAALCSSLGRLCSLEELNVDIKGCMDGLMALPPPPTPYCLQRLLLSRHCPFSKVPTWMGQLRNLDELRCHIDVLLNDSVGILAELPVLTHLDLVICKDTSERISIYGGGAFPALKRFHLRLRSASYLNFLAGAMPKLWELQLKFNAHGWKQSEAAPAGIEHLLALKHLSAQIGCAAALEYEKESAASALRSALNMHPSQPRLGIHLSNYDFFFARE